MLAHTLEFDFDALFQFAQKQLSGLALSSDMRAIGLRAHGEIVAAVIYEGLNARNVWMHVAAVPGKRWLTRMFLRAAFKYPFVICKVARVSGYVDDTNLDARRFNEHLGFKEEARLRGAANDGGDVILYVMYREDCRYVEMAPV